MNEPRAVERMEAVGACSGSVTVEGNEYRVVAGTRDLYNLIASALTAVDQSRDAGVAHRVRRTIEAWLKRSPDNRVPLADLQREAAEVNDLNGVAAFCAGVFAEVARCGSLADAQTCAEMGAQALEEHRAGLWHPGAHDDPATWRGR